MTFTSRNARVAASAALALVGIAAVVIGWGYDVTKEDGQIGAGFMPVVLGCVMAVLAVIDVIGSLRGRTEETETAEDDAEEGDLDVLGRTQRQRNRMLVLVVAMMVLALLLVPVTGLLIALGLLVVGIATVVERRHVLAALLVGAVTIAVVQVVFVVLLKVPMPTGLMGLI